MKDKRNTQTPPPERLLPVTRADIIQWRKDWLDDNYEQDGTDCVTPFDHYLYGDTAISMQIAPTAEQERLRFEGNLDKWMKIIGAGITGFQPEAYAVMDWACAELVTLRARDENQQAALKQIASLPKLAMQDAWQNSRDMRDIALAAITTAEGAENDSMTLNKV